jgi:hypothetical protein
MSNPYMDYAAQFLISEANGTLSRDQVTLVALNDGATVLPAATVLGQITVGTAAAMPGAGNTGTGVPGAISLGRNATPGAYSLQCIVGGAGGSFMLFDPQGNEVGEVQVGTSFSGPLIFTLSDGATHFAVGDTFEIVVTPGSGKYREWDPNGSDGRENACAILLASADVSGAADVQAAIISRYAEVKNLLLNWNSAASNGQISAATAQLALRGIIVRGAQA